MIFIAIKDLSQGIIGKAVDGTMEGPAYLKGYEPKGRSGKKVRPASEGPAYLKGYEPKQRPAVKR